MQENEGASRTLTENEGVGSTLTEEGGGGRGRGRGRPSKPNRPCESGRLTAYSAWPPGATTDRGCGGGGRCGGGGGGGGGGSVGGGWEGYEWGGREGLSAGARSVDAEVSGRAERALRYE